MQSRLDRLSQGLLSAIFVAEVAAGAVAFYLKAYRPWQTRWGASDELVARQLPGDELVARPTWNATRAVEVAATPEQIWPFLVQLGWGRGGWYGYDLVDNRGRPSTWEILPEHQHLEVGKDFPMSPVTAMYCVAFEEPSWMLWQGRRPEPDPDVAAGAAGGVAAGAAGAGEVPSGQAQKLVAGSGTWLWYLDPIDDSHTRLVTRMRDEYRVTSPLIVAQLLTDAFDFPFMRKVLLGIKARAEALAARQAAGEGAAAGGGTFSTDGGGAEEGT